MVRRAGLTPEVVTDAAAALADKEGLESLTLARLASDLGVKSPSLYVHVHGLEGVKDALRHRGLRLLAAELRKSAVGVTKGSAVRALASSYRAFAHAHPSLYEATLRAPDRGDRASQEEAQEVLTVLFEVLRGYRLKGEQAVHAIRLVRSTLHGFVSLERSGGFGLPTEVDRSFDLAVDGICQVLDLWDRGRRT